MIDLAFGPNHFAPGTAATDWHPALMKSFSLTEESESFKQVDLTRCCEIPVGSTHPGAFAVPRRHHIHEGVDLYGIEGDAVHAIAAGELIGFTPFTGAWAGSPWWLQTQAAIVRSEFGTLFYGEIKGNAQLRPGPIAAGALLGWLIPVLATDKGRPRCMLHLELYEGVAKQSCGTWPLGAPRPKGLIDPTPIARRGARLI